MTPSHSVTGHKDTTRRGQYVCLAVVLFCFFSYYAAGIWDSDFWWHIASGKWILDNSALPDIDPFQVFSNADAVRNDTVLKGQWLGQVVLYGFYDAFDTWGVIFLRAGMLIACLYLLFVRSRRTGASLFSTWAVVGLAGLVALGFTADRPQLFSYLLAMLSFLLLEGFERENKIRWLLPLPLIAVAWANTHGAFLLMVVLLTVYCVLFLLQSIARNRKPDTASIVLVVVFMLFVAMTLLTPNGITTYLYLFDLQGSQLQSMTSEYRSSLKLYELGYVLPQLWIVLVYVAALIAIPGLFRAPPQRLVTMVLLAVISVASYRYFAFFIFLAGPYIAQGMTLSLRNFDYTRNKTASIINKFTGLLVMFVAMVFLIVGLNNSWVWQSDIKPGMFPVRAVELIKQRELKGKIFNHMQWGGYLLWQAHPNMQVYIDGRMLEESKIPPYTNILWATPAGIEVFNKANFDYVLLPRANRFSGQEYQLNRFLQKHRDWTVLYQDSETFLYQRRADHAGVRPPISHM